MFYQEKFTKGGKIMENQVFEALRKGENIFITGGAGVGKSYLSRKIKEKYEDMVMLASTGIAALNIGGSTVHSFFGIGKYSHPEDITKIFKSDKWNKIEKRINYASRYILIDEISMIRGDLLNLIDLVCRLAVTDTYKIRASRLDLMTEVMKKPSFGGKTLIFVGDFLQLPPVVRNEEKDEVQALFAFESYAWKNASIKVFNLTEVKRQSDENFINALNAIRIGKTTKEYDELFRATSKNEFPVKPIKLLPTNKKVELWNDYELAQIQAEEETYIARVIARNEFLHRLIVDSCQSPFELKLKVGCQVMITKNGSYEREYTRDEFLKEFPHYAEEIETSSWLGNISSKGEYYQSESDYITDMMGKKEVKYVNGSMGTYLGKYQSVTMKRVIVFDPETGKDIPKMEEELGTLYMRVKLALTGEEIKLYQASWEFNSKKNSQKYIAEKYQQKYGWDESTFKEFDAQFSQFPLRLAYAVTIHKSQGMTLDFCYVDCKGIFADSMLYVALSRARSLEGLQVKSYSPEYVRASEKAVDYYRSLFEEEGNRVLSNEEIDKQFQTMLESMMKSKE